VGRSISAPTLIATGELLRIFEGHSREVTSIAFSPEGARVLSGSEVVKQFHDMPPFRFAPSPTSVHSSPPAGRGRSDGGGPSTDHCFYAAGDIPAKTIAAEKQNPGTAPSQH